MQDIVPPKRRIGRRSIPTLQSEPEPQTESHGSGGTWEKPPRRSPKFGLWIIAFIALISLAFAISFLFSGATVTVFPKKQDVHIDGTAIAKKDALPDELSYEVMTIEHTGSGTVSSTGEEDMEEKASGRIVIYNEYNSANQRLIKNTRFETPEGLTYRIRSSVVVPGRTSDGGKIVPGSIEVTVYADEPGEKYNISLTDFTIPGFKGSPQFNKFYARSKTAMTGGLFGKRLTVDSTVLKNEQDRIHDEIKQQIQSDAQTQVPDGFYLFNSAIATEFESLPRVDHRDTVEVREKVVLYGILISKSEFARHIAVNTVAGFDGGDVRLTDTDNITVRFSDEERLWEQEEISLDIVGATTVIWNYDAEKLAGDLSGRSKDALTTVLSGYPSIERAEAVIRPFWKGSFPEDSAEVKIVEVTQ